MLQKLFKADASASNEGNSGASTSTDSNHDVKQATSAQLSRVLRLENVLSLATLTAESDF